MNFKLKSVLYSEISPAAKVVFFHIAIKSSELQQSNFNDPIDKISEDVKLSKEVVCKSLKQLVNKGAINKIVSREENGHFKTNTYKISE